MNLVKGPNVIDKCRCGYSGLEENHWCHFANYTCKKPAKIRFYNPHLVSLAGVQLKFEVVDTWACDECWEIFKRDYLNANKNIG